MQVDSSMNRKDMSSLSHQSKDFYVTSILKPNALTDLCGELTTTECLDLNVEKFLAEIADNFLDTVIDSACQIAKHKKNDTVTIEDIAIAMEQNFDIYEPSKYSQQITSIKANEIKNLSTNDHKKRMELTKEETKNINI